MSGRHADFLYLHRKEVTALLPPIDQQLALAERTLRAVGRGCVEMPPKPGIHPRPDAFIHAMPAYLPDMDVAAIKWVAGYPSNSRLGLPYISALIVLNDPATGRPSAVMDGAEITAARTAAVSGVCIRKWAPADWTRAALLGCGEQGIYHSHVLRALNSKVEIRAFDPDPSRPSQLPGSITACSSPREACDGAEVVVTAGPIVDNPSPRLSPDWLAERWLVLPLDFDFYVQAATIRAADLFVVDDLAQFAYHSDGRHFVSWPDPSGSVGEALDDRSACDRVACVNLGLGAVDAAFAQAVHVAASDRDLGTRLIR